MSGQIPWLEEVKKRHAHIADLGLFPGYEQEDSHRILALIAIAEAAQSTELGESDWSDSVKQAAEAAGRLT